TLARWLQANGNDGLVIAGTTGEAPTLTDTEHLDLLAAVSEAVTIPVVAGTGSNDTHHAIEMTAKASALGIAGCLVVTPYYNRPSQSGLEAHFKAVAAATALPVIVYDIPIRTGRKVSTDLLLRLARDVTNIVAVKDAAGNPSESAVLLARAPSDLELYSGDDSFTLPLLAIGAVGVIGVATHWSGVEHGEMISSFEKGDVVAARETNARLLESYAFETSDDTPNPIPTKAMMRVLGHAVGQCRPPLGPAPAGTEERARQVIDNLRRV
ncbi:MAG TPA: 4-hydroxy-tetrahydrodipicolinate synthase, partial [Ilumatobacteraceae bacterium]|nr:4-hydroxy-tetrahydrodipicolinate synthase [Ilumatobacteraceae bacterium]